MVLGDDDAMYFFCLFQIDYKKSFAGIRAFRFSTLLMHDLVDCNNDFKDISSGKHTIICYYIICAFVYLSYSNIDVEEREFVAIKIC